MFWSKIWFALVAIAAAVVLTVALVMPRPAQRVRVAEEKQRLAVACGVVNILLNDNARLRIELAGRFSRTEGVAELLADATAAEKFDQPRNQGARDKINGLLTEMRKADEEAGETAPDGAAPDGAEGGAAETRRRKVKRAPDFAILADGRGRVVGRSGIDDAEYGDSMAGLPLVDDALAGYLRDDLWLRDGKLYLVSASPVVKRDAASPYVGAVVLGHAVSTELAAQFVQSLGVNLAFYGGGKVVAASKVQSLDKEIVAAHDKLSGSDTAQDCVANPSFNVGGGAERFTAVVARLPGEARQDGAFYSVFIEQPKAVGFLGTLGSVKSNDLSFGSFPWIPLGIALILVLGAGLALMILEADRPLRRLSDDSVKLAKGEVERLDEERHRGKHGSIARSLNIQIDKLHRDAKTAKKDLDQLLGPAPEDEIGGGMVSSLPPMRPGGASSPSLAPPPSEFKFTEAPRAVKDRSPGGATAGARAGNPPPFELELPGPIGLPTMAAPPPPAATPPGLPMPPGRVRVNTPPPLAPPAAGRPPPLRGRGVAPPPAPPTAPAAVPRSARAIDDDILAVDEDELSHEPSGDLEGPTTVADVDKLRAGVAAAGHAATGEETYFQSVFEQFLELKRKCGEPIAGLTFQKFATKLRKNKEDLIARHHCREVRFQVYVKDGKAALKATPVKEG